MKAPAIVLFILAVAVSAAFPPADGNSCYDGSIPFTDINAANQPDPATNGCFCVSFATWDAAAGYCNPHCQSLAHSDTQPYDTTANTGKCVCTPDGYLYNDTTGTCDLNCLAVANSAGTPPTGGDCACATSAYIWTAANTSCTLDCTLVVNSTNVTNSAGQCDCIPKYKYDSPTTTCTVSCNDIQNTNMTAPQPPAPNCVCGTGYIWNASALSCDVDCTAVTNATGPDGAGGCLCTTPYSFVGTPACQLNCSLVSNATTVDLSPDGTCNCTTPLAWNSTSLSCNLDCSTIPGATGSVNATTCSCNAGSVWNSTSQTCVLNCSNVTSSTGNAVDATTCECVTGFTWNATALSCDINCYGVVHAVAPTNPTPSVAGECTCETNYYFNPWIPKCVINCSLINGSMGINIDTESCQCKPKYTWSVTPTVACKLQCPSIPGSDGSASTNDINCTCLAGYIWNANLTECRRDCTTDAYSTGVLATATKCQCKTGAIWSTTSSKCVVTCAAILNTNGAAAVNNTCVCVTKYTWNPTTLTCVYNC